MSNLTGQVTRLKVLLADNADESREMGRLSILIDTQVSLLNQAIVDTNNGLPAQAVALIATGISKHNMDAVRVVVAELLDGGTRQLGDAIKSKLDSSRSLQKLAYFLLLIVALLSLFGSVVTFNLIGRRAEAEKAVGALRNVRKGA